LVKGEVALGMLVNVPVTEGADWSVPNAQERMTLLPDRVMPTFTVAL
jgi:hypothetical protein